MSSEAARNMSYEEVCAITWSRDIVRHGLGIDERMYALLLSKLQTQMTTLGLLGERLNTAKAKAVLRQGFNIIYREFDDVFCNVSEPWKDRCLTFLAQRCNYNKRRRIKEKRLARRVGEHGPSPAFDVPPLSDTSFPSHTDDEKPAPLKAVRNTMIQVHRDKNQSTSCRPQDLILLGEPEGLIKVDDLDFSKFVSMLKKELEYNDRRDMIVYERAGVATMHISNELEWKTALSEMHTEGSRFPTSSSFESDDPPSADDLPELGRSENDQSSESEAESLNYAPSAHLSHLPVIPTQHKYHQLTVPGNVLFEDIGPSDLCVVSSSLKSEQPYVRYFSGTTAPTSISDDVGGYKEHVENIAAFNNHTEAISGPMSVAAGPRFLRALNSDDLPLPSPPELARSASPFVRTGAIFKSSDQILSDRIRWSVADGIQSWKKNLFATEAERENAIAMNRSVAGREDVAFPDIFRYGVRYNPGPTAQNAHRTVVIEGLLGTVTLKKVLKRVCGGSVPSTNLRDTSIAWNTVH